MPRGEMPPELSDLHCFTETNGIITTTMIDIPGYRVVRVLGAVYGLTVRSRNWAAGLGMVLKSMAGGELRWFTHLVRPSPLHCPPLHCPLPFTDHHIQLLIPPAVLRPQRCHFARGQRVPGPRRQRGDCAAIRRGRHGRVRAGVRVRNGVHCRED